MDLYHYFTNVVLLTARRLISSPPDSHTRNTKHRRVSDHQPGPVPREQVGSVQTEPGRHLHGTENTESGGSHGAATGCEGPGGVN